MTHILVPVDGSASATRAVRWVARVLAGQPGARVELVHVQPAIDAWEVRSHLGADDIARWHASASQAVLEPAAAILREAGLDVTTHPAVGDIASEVAAHVTRLGCDSVVMGTRGLGTVQSLLLGSTAMKVIHVVDVPITLIK
ncbi:MAG: universal stress protein [Acidobacteria bacterium]|nr:universal stress protein [Acidobacteriota bacterium]